MFMQLASGLTSSSHCVNVGISAPFSLPCPSSPVSASFPSLQVDHASHFNGPNVGGLIPFAAERNVVSFPQLTLQNDIEVTDVQVTF